MSDFGQHTSGSSFNSITVNRSVEFSYEELAHATNDFSLANKIGQGGYGLVYYGELRGEVSCFIIIVIYPNICCRENLLCAVTGEPEISVDIRLSEELKDC